MRVSIWLRAVVIPLVSIATIVFTIHRAAVYPSAAMISFAYIVVCLAAFASLATFASVVRGALQNICVMLATLCLGVAGLEAFAARDTSIISRQDQSLYGLDPVLGPRPSKQGRFPAFKSVDGKVIYDVVYTIDNEHRRLTRSQPRDPSRPSAPRVVFFGDSWMFGEGLNDADTLPQVFADITGANVLNYGIEGASPAQALRAMETGLFDKDIAVARLFILQTAPFHIPRTACRHVFNSGAPQYVSIDGKAVYHGRCKARWWRYTGTYRMLLEPFAERIDRRDAETYLAIVDRIARMARDKYHVPLLIINDAWRQPYLANARVGLTSADIEARFKATGAIVVDNETKEKNKTLLELPVDLHPTALANHLVAEKIVATLAAERPKLLEGMSTASAPRADASAASRR